MNVESRTKWVALSFWPGLTPRAWSLIYTQMEDPLSLLDHPEQLNRIKGIATRDVNVDNLLEIAGKEIQTAERNGFGILTWNDPGYPALLRTIPDPPPVIYYQGCMDFADDTCFAVVGTRQPTRYGLDAAGMICKDLAVSGITIVSGLALGIDKVAHEMAIEYSGKTIAVLGCGLDQNYPASNISLRKKIEKHGLILTEYPSQTPPRPTNFPVRNRIISGLSAGVLIVEGRSRSGASITVNLALEQGREVFAVPGPINSPTSITPIRFIQQGAYPVLNAVDILQQLPGITAKLSFEQNRKNQKKEAPLSLDKRYHNLWNELDIEPKPLDDLIVCSGLQTAEVQSILLKLELDGWIKQLPGKNYSLTQKSFQTNSR